MMLEQMLIEMNKSFRELIQSYTDLSKATFGPFYVYADKGQIVFKDLFDEKAITAVEQMSESISGTFDVDTLLQGIVQACVDLSQASKGALYIFDKNLNKLVLRAEVGHARDLRFNVQLNIADNKNIPGIGLTSYTYLNNEPIILNSENEIYNHPAHSGKYTGIDYPDDALCQAWAGIPITDDTGTTIGVLSIENTVDRKPNYLFSSDQIQIVAILTQLIYRATTKVQAYNERMSIVVNNLMNALSQEVLQQNNLEDIVRTFNDIIKADGTSIWLIEGGFLRCKCGVGHYKALEDRAAYDMNISDADSSKPQDNFGLTQWIAKTGNTFHAKTNKEMMDHPHYLGLYDNEMYPDPLTRCESFLGGPLKVNDNVIGVIKANKLTSPEDARVFFTEEDAHIFRLLSIIASYAIKKQQDFKNIRKHDRQTITLYNIGSSCNELQREDEILWYFLIGATHNDGIGFNRAIWFDVIEDSNENILIHGQMSVGPLNNREGYSIQNALDLKNINIELGDTLNAFRNNEFAAPVSDLQYHIESTTIVLDSDGQLCAFIRELDKPCIGILQPSGCGETMKSFLKAMDSENPFIFGIKMSDGRKMVGFCDYVYTTAHERQPDAYNLSLLHVFLNEIDLAISRVGLRSAEESAREKAWRDFSALTAHRIGTEVSDIAGAIRHLCNLLPIDSKADKVMHRNIGRISDSLQRLNVAVNDYTELTKFDKITYSKVDILDLIRTADKDVTVSEREDIDVLIETKKAIPITFSDGEKLLYCFKELLHNAFKAIEDKSKGRVVVRIDCDDKETLAKLDFIDNGVGIPEKCRNKIYDLGYKLRKGGTGLGMHIVKRYIDSLGGTISLEDERKGTHWSIELPVKLEKDILPYKNLLLVEDNKNQGYDIKEEISKNFPLLGGFSWARSEQEGLRKIEEKPFDVIVTDIVLDESVQNDCGGLNILRSAIKKNNETKVIVVSAYRGLEVPKESGIKVPVFNYCRELGAFACIEKNPLLAGYFDRLRQEIEKALFNLN